MELPPETAAESISLLGYKSNKNTIVHFGRMASYLLVLRQVHTRHTCTLERPLQNTQVAFVVYT